MQIKTHSLLAFLLQKYHGKINGVLRTNYAKIQGLRILASTTNGTSGLGIWNRRKVYFHKNKDGFVVERV